MTLKELQKMIKEEFDAYMEEAADDVDVAVSDADVDVDAEQDGSEDMLRKIYDMLKDKFEAEEGEDMDEMMYDEEKDMEEDVDEMSHSMEEDMVDEVKDDEDKNEAADMEEAADTAYGSGKAGKGTTGYDGKTGGKGTTGYDAGSQALQERFKKLANIIK